MKNKKQWVFSNEELIEKCLEKISKIHSDQTLFSQQLKIDLIKQWLYEIEKIQGRKPLETIGGESET